MILGATEDAFKSVTRLNLILIALVIIGLDWWTKYLVQTRMALHQTIPLPVDFVQLTYVHNYGGAFGIFAHQRLFFVLAAAVAIGGILYFFREISQLGKLSFWAGALILGGAIGNLIDRLRWGYVVDFIDLRWWPVFNVADIALTVGVSLMFIELVWVGAHPPAEEKREGAEEGAKVAEEAPKAEEAT